MNDEQWWAERRKAAVFWHRYWQLNARPKTDVKERLVD